MHADEDRVAITVSPLHPLVEIHEAVVAAHHHHPEVATKVVGNPFGRVQREVFFLLPGGPANSTAVLAAVTGVDDDRLKPFWPGPVAINIAPGRGAGRRGGAGNKQGS